MPIIKKKKNTTSIKQVVKQRVNVNVHIGNKGNKKRRYNKKPAQSQGGQSSFTPVYIQSGYPSHLENIVTPAHAPIPAPLAPPILVNTSTPARTLLNPIPPRDLIPSPMILPSPMSPSTPQIRIIQPQIRAPIIQTPIHNNEEQIFRIGDRIVTQAQRTVQDERNRKGREKRRERAALKLKEKEMTTPQNVTQRDNRRGGGGGGFSGGAFS